MPDSAGPRITTVIPTYHRPEMLKRAVLSVLDQTYPHLIVRILDNGDDEETAALGRELMESDSRIEYYRHPANIGSLNNIIYGIESVETEFFSILSDDDMLMPDFYSRALRLHEAAPSRLSFVAARVVTVNAAGEFSDDWPHPEPTEVLETGEGVRKCIADGVSLPGALYRTSVTDEVGVPREAWWNWTESGWNALVALEAPLGIIPDIGAIVFVHPNSGSKRMAAAEFRVTWFRMLEEVRKAAEPILGDAWWRRNVLPLAWPRLLATSVRLAGGGHREELRELATTAPRAGLSRSGVRAVLGAALGLSRTGLGSLLNRLGSRIRQQDDGAVGFRSAEAAERLAGAAEVYARLNERAGIAVMGVAG